MFYDSSSENRSTFFFVSASAVQLEIYVLLAVDSSLSRQRQAVIFVCFLFFSGGNWETFLVFHCGFPFILYMLMYGMLREHEIQSAWMEHTRESTLSNCVALRLTRFILFLDETHRLIINNMENLKKLFFV